MSIQAVISLLKHQLCNEGDKYPNIRSATDAELKKAFGEKSTKNKQYVLISVFIGDYFYPYDDSKNADQNAGVIKMNFEAAYEYREKNERHKFLAGAVP